MRAKPKNLHTVELDEIQKERIRQAVRDGVSSSVLRSRYRGFAGAVDVINEALAERTVARGLAPGRRAKEMPPEVRAKIREMVLRGVTYSQIRRKFLGYGGVYDAILAAREERARLAAEGGGDDA